MNKSVTEGDKGPQFGLGGTRVAVLGYGAEGRAQALRLRNEGLDVVVAVRPGGMSWVRALKDGFRPATHAEAVAGADVVALMVPDAEQPALYSSSVAPHIKPGALLVFAHGAPVHSKALVPRSDVDVVLVTRRFDDEGGAREMRCFVAVHTDATGSACGRAVAYARVAFGEGAATIATTTFAQETAMDLCDQAFQTGGVSELLATWEKLLASAGHEPDEACLAYYERLKSVVADSSPSLRATPPPPPSSHAAITAQAAEGGRRGEGWDEILKHAQRGVA